ncbi:MAG TPA: EmrB/QacA family drug resistance transporter, partial [Burkholderiaceae bacterium]
GLGILNGLVDRQAAMMAYLDDFRFMLALTALSLPLLLLIRKPQAAPGKPGAEAEPELVHEV